MKKYYISLLIGLVVGLILTFASISAEISFIFFFISGIISGYIADEKLKIGMINGLICGFGFSISTILIFYMVRTLEGFQIPAIPMIIVGFFVSVFIFGLICAIGGAIGSYIKKRVNNRKPSE